MNPTPRARASGPSRSGRKIGQYELLEVGLESELELTLLHLGGVGPTFGALDIIGCGCVEGHERAVAAASEERLATRESGVVAPAAVVLSETVTWARTVVLLTSG